MINFRCRYSKKQKKYQDKISSWASSRASLTDLQLSAFKSQHNLKIKLMQEKHDLKEKDCLKCMQLK